MDGSDGVKGSEGSEGGLPLSLKSPAGSVGSGEAGPSVGGGKGKTDFASTHRVKQLLETYSMTGLYHHAQKHLGKMKTRLISRNLNCYCFENYDTNLLLHTPLFDYTLQPSLP